MVADLNRRQERRRLDRRSGDERRHNSANRRRSDREQLLTLDEEEAVQARMRRVDEDLPPVRPEDDEFEDQFAESPRPRLLRRWWALLKNVWGWK